MNTNALLMSGVLVALCATGHSQTVLDIVDRGGYGMGGGHVPSNLTWTTGNITTGEKRSFYVYDLSTIDGPIVSAQFRFEIGNFFSFSGEGFENFGLFDVTTPFDALLDGSAEVEAFDDLGMGLMYGERILTDADDDSFITIDLNQNAIDSLNALIASGIDDQRWALGGAITTLDNDLGTFEGFVVPEEFEQPSQTQLILTTIPAPSAYAGLVGAGLTMRRRRRAR